MWKVFVNVFSQAVTCIFILLIVYFTDKILMKSNLWLYSFMNHAFVSCLGTNPKLQIFTSVFSSKSYVVLGFAYSCMIYFELSFVCAVRSRFMFCLWTSSCSNIICWKDNLCFVVLPLLLCWRSLDCVYIDLFVLLSIPYCFD